jgi:hypothetical protein
MFIDCQNTLPAMSHDTPPIAPLRSVRRSVTGGRESRVGPRSLPLDTTDLGYERLLSM